MLKRQSSFSLFETVAISWLNFTTAFVLPKRVWRCLVCNGYEVFNAQKTLTPLLFPFLKAGTTYFNNRSQHRVKSCRQHTLAVVYSFTVLYRHNYHVCDAGVAAHNRKIKISLYCDLPFCNVKNWNSSYSIQSIHTKKIVANRFCRKRSQHFKIDQTASDLPSQLFKLH